MYAIYMKYMMPCRSGTLPKVKQVEAVYLTDGAWALEEHCFDTTGGSASMVPKLFKSKRNAQDYAKRMGKVGERYSVHRYTGPDIG